MHHFTSVVQFYWCIFEYWRKFAVQRSNPCPCPVLQFVLTGPWSFVTKLSRKLGHEIQSMGTDIPLSPKVRKSKIFFSWNIRGLNFFCLWNKGSENLKAEGQHFKGCEKNVKNLRGLKFCSKKIRGLKKIAVPAKNAPTGYPDEKMTHPLHKIKFRELTFDGWISKYCKMS